MAAAAPRRIEIVPWGFWKSSTSWSNRVQNSALLGGGRLYGGSATSAVSWEVLLDSGTWAVDVIWTGSTTGDTAVDVSLGGSSLGTINMDNPGNNQVTTYTGITVVSVGYYSIALAQSIAQDASVQLITLRRTGA